MADNIAEPTKEMTQLALKIAELLASEKNAQQTTQNAQQTPQNAQQTTQNAQQTTQNAQQNAQNTQQTTQQTTQTTQHTQHPTFDTLDSVINAINAHYKQDHTNIQFVMPPQLIDGSIVAFAQEQKVLATARIRLTNRLCVNREDHTMGIFIYISDLEFGERVLNITKNDNNAENEQNVQPKQPPTITNVE